MIYATSCLASGLGSIAAAIVLFLSLAMVDVFAREWLLPVLRARIIRNRQRALKANRRPSPRLLAWIW